MRLMTLIAAVCAGAVAMVSPARAGDDNPPPWRGLPLTTTQGWSFFAGPGSGAPNLPGAHNPYTHPSAPGPLFLGGPGATFGTTPVPGPTGGPLLGWTIAPGGFLEFIIPNNYDPTTIKEVWVQIKFAGAVPSISGTGFHPDGSIMSPGFPPLDPPVFTPGPSPIPGVSEYTLRMQFDGNPAYEIIRIHNHSTSSPMFIYQVVIDTICPAPGSAAAGLLGLGLVGMRRRR